MQIASLIVAYLVIGILISSFVIRCWGESFYDDFAAVVVIMWPFAFMVLWIIGVCHILKVLVYECNMLIDKVLH